MGEITVRVKPCTPRSEGAVLQALFTSWHASVWRGRDTLACAPPCKQQSPWTSRHTSAFVPDLPHRLLTAPPIRSSLPSPKSRRRRGEGSTACQVGWLLISSGLAFSAYGALVATWLLRVSLLLNQSTLWVGCLSAHSVLCMGKMLAVASPLKVGGSNGIVHFLAANS